MPEAVYKDTPNNRKLGRVGEKFGDPKFKTTKKAAAPKKEPAPKKAPAPKKNKPKKEKRNLLNNEVIEWFLRFFEIVEENGSDINYNFDNIDEATWNANVDFIIGYDYRFDPDTEEPLDLEEAGLVDYDRFFTKNVKRINEILRAKWDKGAMFSDFSEKDQEEFNEEIYYGSGKKYGTIPKDYGDPLQLTPALAVPPIVMPYAHINPAVDFMISQKGPGSMPIKNFGSAVKPVLKKKSVEKPKSIVEIQKQKDKDKLKNFKQYQDYVQLF